MLLAETAEKGLGDWLYTQGVSTVLLVLLVGVLVWFARYAVMKAVPQHLESIQQGYKAIHDDCASERKETREMFERVTDKIVERFDQTVKKQT